MSQPIEHSQAAGIHPGAFVQAAEPSTALVQDGVLWVDTSSPPPYPLKCWDQEAAVWRLVGPFDGDCLVFAEGESICLSPTTLLIQTVDPEDGSPVNYVYGSRTTLALYAGGVERLVLPLPTLSVPPTVLVGQDPGSGLPAFCPQPEQPASGSKRTPPATGTDCTQTRCGAALAMTQHLEDLYDTWRTWINAAIGAVASLSIGVILDWLAGFIGALVVAERVGSSTLTIFNNLRPLLAALTGVELSGVLPVWDATTVDNVQRVFFSALQCTGTDVSVSADDMTNVAGYMRANTASFLGNIVSELLALSCEYSALTDWQAKITGATPSGLCAGY